MKYSIIILFLFSISVQGQKKAEKLFQTAISYYESGKYFEAGIKFQEIVENYKKFKFYDQCFYNTAYSYNQADSLDLAITWCEKIRTSGLKDSDQVGGRGIFEPYANYKHYSTFNIAKIEYNRANYNKALDYYRQSLEQYNYYNHSKADLRINKNKLIIYITDCFEKLERYEEALTTIIPEVLDSKGSSNYKSVTNKAIELITEHFDKKEIKSELEIAFKTLTKSKKNESFMITFRAKKLKLFPYWLDDNSIDGLKKNIKKSLFWKLLIDM